MAKNNENGYWFSLENGTHIFVKKGQTPEQATNEYLNKAKGGEHKVNGGKNSDDDFDNDYDFENWGDEDEFARKYGYYPVENETKESREFLTNNPNMISAVGKNAYDDAEGYNINNDELDQLVRNEYLNNKNISVSQATSNVMDYLKNGAKPDINGEKVDKNQQALENTFKDATLRKQISDYENLRKKGYDENQALEKVFGYLNPTEDDLMYESDEYNNNQRKEKENAKKEFMEKYNEISNKPVKQNAPQQNKANVYRERMKKMKPEEIRMAFGTDKPTDEQIIALAKAFGLE